MGSVATTRMKIPTADLIKEIEKRKARAKAQHARDTATYAERVAKHQDRVIAALETALERARLGKFPEAGYRRLDVPFTVGHPSKPKLDLLQIDRMLKALSMTTDTTITLSSADAAYYLG